MSTSVYLTVPLDHIWGAGIVAVKNSRSGEIGMSVYHSVKQGIDALEEYGVPVVESVGLISEMRNGTYCLENYSRFVLPPLAASWLVDLLVANSKAAIYQGVMDPRICALKTFASGETSCGIALVYWGGPCQVHVFHSQEQLESILDHVKDVTHSSPWLGDEPIDTLMARLPEYSELTIQALVGPGAAFLCAGVEASGRAQGFWNRFRLRSLTSNPRLVRTTTPT